jgi:hypothetical protein
MSAGFTRRGFLAGAFGTVAAAGGAVALAGCGSSTRAPAARPAVIPFRGAHQAGIATPAQDRLAFAAFDVTSTSRAELIDLLRRWTAAAEKMTRGEPGGAVEGPGQYVPADTGEATGLPAANLTVTSASDRASSTTASTWPAGGRRRCANCPPSPATRSTPGSAAATSASRPAPTIRRWPSTRCATSTGSVSG